MQSAGLRVNLRKECRVADDLKQAGKPDDARINVEQEHELK